MKIWQLHSISSGNKSLLIRTAEGNREWANIGKWYHEFDEIVDKQERSILDTILPEDYVLAVLEKIQTRCYKSADGWVRLKPLDKKVDTAITVSQIYKEFGGDQLEEIFEYGSVHAKKL